MHVVCSDAFAGVERYITYTAPGLARRGWEVVVVGGNRHRMQQALGDAGIVHLPAATTAQAARQLLRCRPLDLVHAHMSMAELAAVVTAPLVRAPIVTTRHFAARRGSSVKGRLAAVVIRRAVACQIAISRFVAGAIDGPSVLLPSGVPPSSAPPERRPVVLMAQRLEEEKDVAVGLRAWAASGLPALGWSLVIAGGGSLGPHLRELADDLGVAASVSFIGARESLDDLFREAGIFLATARAEPFGLSVVEAMAGGLPVVASASGAHLETVGACSGAWLFPAGDHEACAQRLRLLASVGERRASYGEALQQVHRRYFDVDLHVDRLVEVYDRTGRTAGIQV